MKTCRTLLCLVLALLMLGAVTALAETAPADDGTIRLELTSLEVSRLMGNGTNLGNTMEACNTNAIAPGNSPMTYEVSWRARHHQGDAGRHEGRRL